MSKNVVLTGMMGVGKSTIGKKLAEKLSYSFMDIDHLIEKKEGSSIKIIFKNKGESYFRKIEQEITLEILKKRDLVIALGGGAFLNKSIRRFVKQSSISFWIDVKTDILIKRLEKTEKRPLLLKGNLNETVNKIYLARKKTYSESDFRIKCNFETKENIIEKIFKLYESSKIKG